DLEQRGKSVRVVPVVDADVIERRVAGELDHKRERRIPGDRGDEGLCIDLVGEHVDRFTDAVEIARERGRREGNLRGPERRCEGRGRESGERENGEAGGAERTTSKVHERSFGDGGSRPPERSAPIAYRVSETKLILTSPEARGPSKFSAEPRFSRPIRRDR